MKFTKKVVKAIALAIGSAILYKAHDNGLVYEKLVVLQEGLSNNVDRKIDSNHRSLTINLGGGNCIYDPIFVFSQSLLRPRKPVRSKLTYSYCSYSFPYGSSLILIQPPTYEIPEDIDFYKTMVVGFPSGDKRMTFVQMEALTGWAAKDEWDFEYLGTTNNPFIKANYPHHGKRRYSAVDL